MKKVSLGIALLVSVLVPVLLSASSYSERKSENNRFAENVNLALRHTAHRLLAASGDSVSRIEPVQQTDANIFTLRLMRPFEYEHIPSLLQESLVLHGIESAYNVAILDCNDGTIQLGYNYQDLATNQVACIGRQEAGGCRTLQITFTESRKAASNIWWASAFGFLLVGISGLVWYRVVEKSGSSERQLTGSNIEAIQLGKFLYHPAEQSIDIEGISRSLTFRENKLLRLFATHPNQLLERELILKLVWEDEGVIVGRSVDVFVSRLRKLLRDDPAVRIASVHGVGYRLEVAAG